VTWKPGQSGNPAGRVPGTRNKRSVELWDKLEALGHRDCAEFLSSIVHDDKADANLRVTAASALMPYRYSKRGLTSEPAPLVFIETPVELPHPHATEIRQAIENIEYLSALRQTGKLDLASADALISDQRLIRDGLIEEHKALIAQCGPKDQIIQILGGLPPLPGTSIDMGKEPLGALGAVVNGEAVHEGFIGPPVPFIPPEGSPLAQKPGPPEPPLAKPDSVEPDQGH
jgi:hypothetical protein